MAEMTIKEFAKMGGHARAETLSPEELSEQGRQAAQARWDKTKDEREARKKAKRPAAKKKAAKK